VASRTVAHTVEKVFERPRDLAALDLALGRLRERHPHAILERYLGRIPRIATSAHVAAGAAIIGDVELGEEVSVWYGCVIRGDVSHVRIRARSNLQDGVVIHLGDRDPTDVEEDVVVGHRAVLHGCHIAAGCLIGISATVLDGAVVGEGSVVGAGCLVTAGTRIPPRSLVLGMPGKVVKRLTEDDEAFHRQLAAKYVRLAHNYREG
jgi:carbonic anhydrase/acetyltransferase-like protein (isoleucine patch superfamily)